MLNIINVKEERNVLSFVGEVFNIVANSTNFYLKFELDSEWELNSVVTAIFNFDGRYEYVELDEDRMCQIPPTNSSRIWFCLTTEPDEVSKLSSTILSLDVEASGETDLSRVEAYQNTHANLLGLVQNLLTGNNIKAKTADFANVAAVSQSQVSLTGDEEIAGEKNFTGTLKQNSSVVLDYSKISNENLILNPNFTVVSRGSASFTRDGEDIYTADRWGLFKGNGKFIPSSHKLTGLDESQPTVFGQWVENGERFMFGETITVSATINDVRYAKTIQLPETYAEDYINNVYECDDFVFRIYVHKIKKVVGVQFLVVNGVSIKIYNVKLEVSPFETKYVDRSKREEVELCHKFYQELSIYSLGYGMSDGLFRFFVPTEARLRGIVKVNFKLIPKVAKNGELIELSETITSYQQVDNGVVLIVQTTDFVQNEIYYLVDGKICVDGEFYLWLMKL